MSSYEAFHKVIQARVDIQDKLHGGDPLWQWEMIVNQFCADIPLSISFIHDEISDTELYWLSEVFDKLLLKTKSHELLDSLKARATQVQDLESKNEITDELEEAIGVSGMFA